MSELGLRERKKQRTRTAIQTEAMRLFTSRGYEHTTCEQVAAAADVSPATLFRYFADKEALVLDDDYYDPIFLASLEHRPDDEPLIPALRAALAEAFSLVLDADSDLIRPRFELVLSVPALRARMNDQMMQDQGMVVDEVARRLDDDPASLRVRAVAGAISGAMAAGIRAWALEGGDLLEIFDQALAALEHDLGG